MRRVLPRVQVDCASTRTRPCCTVLGSSRWPGRVQTGALRAAGLRTRAYTQGRAAAVSTSQGRAAAVSTSVGARLMTRAHTVMWRPQCARVLSGPHCAVAGAGSARLQRRQSQRGSSGSALSPRHVLCRAASSSTQPPEAQSLGTRFRASRLGIMWKKYGYVFVATYGAAYVGTLFLLYGALSSSLFCKGDAVTMMKQFGLENWLDGRELTSSKGNLAVAWVLTKFTEPLRMGFTLAVVPSITRILTGRREEKEEKAKEEAEAEARKASEDRGKSDAGATPDSN